MYQFLSLSFLILASGIASANQEKLDTNAIHSQVDTTITKLIREQNIPGMAVVIVYDGKPHYYTYGLANTKRKKPVTTKTIFELGSLSKTFTGVLGGDSVARHEISLSDPVQKHWPSLTSKQWDGITLLHLITYSAGGLPLQFPDNINNPTLLFQYYQNWKPEWASGSKRLYSNPSIGLFGKLTASAANMEFESAIRTRIFEPLELNNTWFSVPQSAQENYAWGYLDNQPRRVSAGMLDKEAYGIKTSIEDMGTWLQANMNVQHVKSTSLQQGIQLSQQAYYQADNTMYQGLGWEMYGFPLQEDKIISNSGNDKALLAHKLTPITTKTASNQPYFIHKTGATSGFGGYIALIPSKKMGIAMLANKNYPNPERVKAALTILNSLSAIEDSDK